MVCRGLSVSVMIGSVKRLFFELNGATVFVMWMLDSRLKGNGCTLVWTGDDDRGPFS